MIMIIIVWLLHRRDKLVSF